MTVHGYTLVLLQSGIIPREFHLHPAPQEVRSEKNALTTLIPLPNLSVYRESHGDGIEEVTLSGSFGYKRRQVGNINRSGDELFLEFKRTFWKEYLRLLKSTDPIDRLVKIEYHNWDEDEHYYCEPTRFVTPRGPTNRTFFTYELTLRLYQKIERKLTIPVKDKLTVVDRIRKFLKAVAEKLSEAGQWLAEKAQVASSWVTRNITQPLAELIEGIDDFVDGVSAIINFPVKSVIRLSLDIAATIEKLGVISGTFLTDAANTLRNTRRMLNRLAKTPDTFKKSITDGQAELAEQYYQLIDTVVDSEAVQEEKRAGRNLMLKEQGERIKANSYLGAKKVRVRTNDTLQKIALRELGSASQWREIAIMNGLDDADISTLAGTDILVPTVPALEGSGVVGDLGDDDKISNATMAERLYGRDLKVVEEGGKLSVVFGANNDLTTVGGEENLIQAVQIKTRIFQGQLLENPDFGMPWLVGRKATPRETLALVYGLKETATSDPRIDDAAVTVSRVGNYTQATFELYPAGIAGERPINAVVGV